MTLEYFNSIKHQILPFIQSRNEPEWGTNQKKIQIDSEKRPVYAPLPGDLICLFGVKTKNIIWVIMKHQLPKGVTPRQIDKLAKKNLTKILQDKITVEKEPWGALRLTTGDAYESATCMLGWVWEYLMETLGDEIIFAIPASDVILFLPAGNKTGLIQLEKKVKAIHKKSNQKLSKKIFKYDGWNSEVVKE